jgi:hypothetical protein
MVLPIQNMDTLHQQMEDFMVYQLEGQLESLLLVKKFIQYIIIEEQLPLK